MERLIQQILGFGVVGGIAFVIDFGVMIALTELFGLDPVVSAAISFIVSLIFNYVASMRFVFSHRDDLSRSREFIIFVVLSAVGLGINELVMRLGTDMLSIDYRFVKVAATAIVMVWNFLSRRKWLDAGEK
ncbi:MAG: GtrA family protein, partial [Atopobiaceae bacterium]|nr:GtrA family protein [Atopobiaceae bacterium]